MSIISCVYGWLRKQAEKSELECRRVELSLLEENPDARLLDFGCGNGEFTFMKSTLDKLKVLYAVPTIA